MPTKFKRLITSSLVAGGIMLAGGLLANQIAIDESRGSAAVGASLKAQNIVVGVQKLQQETGYNISREFLGRVEAGRRSAVGFELSGKIVSLEFDEGDKVAQGEILAVVDTERFESQLTELDAEKERLVAQLELAEIQVERRKSLLEEKSISVEEYDEFRTKVSELKASLRLVEARTDSLSLEIDKSTLRAPFDAVVQTRYIDEGAVVSQGQSVFELLEDSVFEARIGLPRRFIDNYSLGDRIPIMAGDLVLSGKVKALLPAFTANTRTVQMVVELYQPTVPVREGDLVVLSHQERVDAQGFWIPLSSMTDGVRGLWSVYVAHPTNDSFHAQRREIEVIHKTQSLAFVRGMIDEGDLAILSGNHKVVPGLEIEVADEGV